MELDHLQVVISAALTKGNQMNITTLIGLLLIVVGVLIVFEVAVALTLLAGIGFIGAGVAFALSGRI